MPYPQIFSGDDREPRDNHDSILHPAATNTTAITRPDRATLEAHLARRHYGGFTLTDAVRPGWQLDVVPQAG